MVTPPTGEPPESKRWLSTAVAASGGVAAVHATTKLPA